MIWYDIWYGIWYMIWYIIWYMIWYIWYMIWCMIWYDVWYDVWYFICYDIYLLTAIGYPPGSSSTVHIYTHTIQRTTQNKQYTEQHKHFGRVRAVTRLCGFYPGICLTTGQKAHKNLSQGSRRVARWRYKNIQQDYIAVTIKIHELHIKQKYNHIYIDKK